MEKTRLMIIEDSNLLRKGLNAMFKNLSEFEITAALGDSLNIIKKLKEQKPEILLMDISLVKQDSLVLVRKIKKKFPKLKIIVMHLLPVQPDIKHYIDEGINGFILKNASTEEFLNTIKNVALGKKVLPADLDKSMISEIVDDAVDELMESKLMESIRMTDIEKKIIDYVSAGMTDKEISKRLKISVPMVKSNIDNILEKMSLSTRVQIAIYKNTDEEQ